MMEQGVEAVLARLVAQFPSPYDFVRELVQNAMDGGADRLEVLLDRHAGDSEDEVVYGLRFEDTGRGMTQDVVREELTRLFASSKSGDRTSAGEFGVGFVSVFAWRPDAVLLQTGREGEAWELLFDGSATFEERPVDVPFEGTTITMFRRGRASEGAAIAEAVRDALWRWCRFCSLRLSSRICPPRTVPRSSKTPGAQLERSARSDSHSPAAPWMCPSRGRGRWCSLGRG